MLAVPRKGKKINKISRKRWERWGAWEEPDEREKIKNRIKAEIRQNNKWKIVNKEGLEKDSNHFGRV